MKANLLKRTFKNCPSVHTGSLLASGLTKSLTLCINVTGHDLNGVNFLRQVCPSYPRAVVVPAIVSDEMLKASAAFRMDGRFPILSYRHSSGVRIIYLFSTWRRPILRSYALAVFELGSLEKKAIMLTITTTTLNLKFCRCE